MSDQLTLDQAAQNHAAFNNYWRGPVREQKEINKIMHRSFTEGAEWQKEQYNRLIELIIEGIPVLNTEGFNDLTEQINNELERLQD